MAIIKLTKNDIIGGSNTEKIKLKPENVTYDYNSYNIGRYKDYKKLGIDNLQSDLAALGKTIQGVYDGWQTQDTMKNTKASVESMYNRLTAFQDYRKKYGITQGDKEVDELVKAYKTTLDDWDAITSYYGNFKDEKAYKNAQAYAKKIAHENEKAKTEDIDALENQLNVWKKEYKRLIDGKEWQWNKGPDGWRMDEAGMWVTPYSATTIDAFVGKTPREINELISEREAYLNKARKIQKDIYYDEKIKSDDLLKKGRDVWKEYQEYQAGLTPTQKAMSEYANRHLVNQRNGKNSSGDFEEFLRMIQDYARGNDDKSYQEPNNHWSQEELNQFYIRFAENKEDAFDYAANLNNQKAIEKQNNKLKKTSAWATKNVGTEILATLGLIPATLVGGIFDYADDLRDKHLGRRVVVEEPNVSLYEWGSSAQGAISEKLNEKGGTINEDFPIIGGKGWGDVYNLGTSIAGSGLTTSIPYVGPLVTAISFFGQGAAGAVDDAVARGATIDEALAYGTIVGAAEAVSEYIGADKLMSLTSKSAVKSAFRLALEQAGAEGLEEIFSALIDNIADSVIMGENSKFNLLVEKYQSEGMSRDEAVNKAWTETVEDIAYNGLSGAASGGLHAAPVLSVNAVRNNIMSKITYGSSPTSINAIVENGLAMPKNSEAYKLAVKSEAKLKSGKSLSGTALYNLATAIESEIETKSEARLSELGVDKKTAKELSPVVAKAVFGEKLSSAEHSTLNNSEIAVQVVKELSADRANTVWKDAIKNSRINNVAENNSVTEQGDVLQSTADGVVDNVADNTVAQQGGQVDAAEGVGAVQSDSNGVASPGVVDGADGKQYFDDGSGDEYFGDTSGDDVAHGGDEYKNVSHLTTAEGGASPQGEAVDSENSNDLQLNEPALKDIARAPTAEEAIEEAITGKQKTNIQRHIVDICKKLFPNITVEFVNKIDEKGKINGVLIRSQNKILIKSNLNAVQMYVEVFKHEFMHRLETKQLYSKFFNYCFKNSKAFEQYVRAELKAAGFEIDSETREGVLQDYTKYKYEQYKNAEGIPKIDRDALTMENAREEIIADFFAQILFQGKQYRARIIEALENADGEALIGIGDEVSSEAALMELQQKEPTLFEQVIEWFKDVINRLRGLPQAKSLVEQLDNEINLLESMARRAYQSKDSKRLMKKKLAEEKYSIGEIVDQNNKSYGIGVILDSSRLDSLSPKERIKEVKKYVKSLGGNGFTAYDNNGNIVKITIAKSNDRFKNHKGKSIPVNKDLTNKYINNETKQEAITLIDELVATSKYDNSKPALYSHGWVDNNGNNNWEYWTTYIQDRNKTIWEATLNIANTANGEKILYDITPIKKAGQSIELDTSSANNSISNSTQNVNTEKSNDKSNDTPSGQYSLGSPIQQMRYNPEAYAKHLKRKYQSKADGDAVAKMIKQIVAQDNKSAKAQEDTRQKVYDRKGNLVGELTLKERLINELAVEISESIEAPLMAEADEVLSGLKERPLRVNEKQEAEIRHQFGTLANFRKDTGIRLVSEKSEVAAGLTTLEDAWNGDWVTDYAGWFKDDVSDVNMPIRLAEIVEQLNGMTEELNTEAIAAEVADSLTKTLNETGPKAEKRRVNEAYRRGVADEHAKNEKQISELQKQNRNLKNRVKPKDVQNIRKEVERIYKKLAANSSTKHVHQGLKKAVSEFLELFNQSDEFTFKPADRDKVTRLWREYQKLTETDATSEAYGYDAQIAINIEMLEDILPGRSMWELHPDELAQVKEIIQNVSHCIENVNNMIIEGKTEEIATVANSVRVELGHKKGKIFDLGKLDLDMKNTTPVYFFERLGSKTLQKLFGGIKKGENVWAKNMLASRDKIAEIRKRYGYNKWKEVTLKFTTKLGDQIELDLEQAMLLYATVKRERANLSQEAEHTYIGGVVIPTKKVKSLMSDIRGFTKRDGESDANAKKRYEGLVESLRKQINVAPHQIRVSDFAKVSDFLTEQQKAYVDEMVAYLSNDMAKLGNEVSMQLFGIEKFNEKYYIPYNSADNFIASMPGVEPTSSIKHRSFTKDLTHGANNPLMLTSFSEVCANHIEQMCMYNAMAIPVDNLTRVLNYTVPGTETSKATSTKDEIERVLGKSGLRYINNLIRDMSGSVRVSDLDSLVGRFTSRYKKAAVLASLSVVIQQPTSIVRAFKYIPAKYFLKTTFKVAERNYEQMKRYVGEAIIKEMGGFDTGVGATNSDYLLQPKRTVGQFIDDVAGWGANEADQITWGHIWAASKRMVAEQNPSLQVGSDAFFEKAAEICSETLSKTQVYDSVLVKSEAMRSKSELSKMMTAFMSEPTVTYNMMMGALRDVTAHKKGAVKALAGTSAVIIGQIVVNAAFKSLVYAMRDDDEDETYFEKWLASFVESSISDLNYFNYLPYLKDIVSIMQGYSVERMDVAAIADIKQAIEKAFAENATDLERLKNLCTAFSLLTGVPVKNIWRDAEGAYNTIHNAIKKDMVNTPEGSEKAAKVGFAEALDWLPGIEIDTDGSARLVSELEGNVTYDSFDDADKKKVEDGVSDYLKNSEKFEKGELRSKSKTFESLYEMRRKYGNTSKKYRKERKKLIDSGIDEKDLELGLEIAKFKYLEQNGITVAEYYAAKTELNRKDGGNKVYDTDGSGGLNKKETKAAIKKMKGFDENEKDILFDILKP